jgi:hypothetical protein
MIRMILVAAGVALLATNSVLAQSNCDQIREAVATYGYEAARAHALAHYGEEAVAEGDKCLTDMPQAGTPATQTTPPKVPSAKTLATKTRATGKPRTKSPPTKTLAAKTPPAKALPTKTPDHK